MADDNPENKQALNDGSIVNYMPTKNFFVTTPGKDQLISNGLLKAGDSNKVSTDMRFTWNKPYLSKDQVAIMNIIAGIAKEGWKRPICFGGGLPGDNYLNLSEYMRTDGVVLRLMPFKYVDSVSMTMPNREPGFVNLDKCVNLYTKTYQWGNAQRKDVYFDEKNRLMFFAYRIGAARVAENLTARGRNAEALQVLDKVMDNISEESMQYDRVSFMMAAAYTSAGAKDKGRKLALKIAKNAEDDINWILSLNEDKRSGQVNEVRENASLIYQMGQNMTILGDPATGKELQDKANLLIQKVQGSMGNVIQ
ncbi:MAG TPA: hypothetical protein VL092_13750 [Chitinophagaceae bacterium]|nr:hypothetical protein [Chitinophagaceae bacterium]